MKLQDKVAIVTGAQTGIGRAIAERIAAEGGTVVLADINDAMAAAAGITASGGKATAIQVDVADEASVEAMVQRAMQAHGRVDILVNNAAIASGLELRPFETISAAEWRRMQDVNAMGPFLCCRAVAPHMRKQRSGRIVNMTSGTAFKGAPFMLDYVASKGALMTMTRALARELGSDFITVNAVSPGYTLSEGVLANTELLGAYREEIGRAHV